MNPMISPATPVDYLAVTDDGELIGQASQHVTSLRLHFDSGVQELPVFFRLYPQELSSNVRQAPALIARTAHGIPATARLKVQGHYLVRSYARHLDSPMIVLNGVYEQWQWRRVQTLAESPLNGYQRASTDPQEHAPPTRPALAIPAQSPLLIAGFRPRLP